MGMTKHQHRRRKAQSRNVSTGRMQGRGWLAIRTRILERDGHVCQARDEGCETEAIEVHHIVPIELGGTNDDDNLISLCGCCHYRRTTQQRQESMARKRAGQREARRRNHPGRKDRHDPP
ncbi:HNH endonuclease [Mycobacterium avium]|uniref:HNH endonuclease n=1 Tax=Mycobacterium avium TaxID=1764 RepID=UPI00148215CA|nr:HNH endonuclease signature motif containing protein [Mycobacterium avium]